MRVLGAAEELVLQDANKIYAKKDFEYFSPEDALTGFTRYPQLDALDALARKLVGLRARRPRSRRRGTRRSGRPWDALRKSR